MDNTQSNMRKKEKCPFYWAVLLLTIIGGLNWGLVGLFNFNLVAAIFGEMTTASRAVYIIVGISALMLLLKSMCMCKKSCHVHPHIDNLPNTNGL